MKSRVEHWIMYIMVVMMTLAAPAGAGEVSVFLDRSEWEDAVGDFTTIDFTGFPHLTPITDQYADQGVLFSGSNFILGPDEIGFPNDGWGMTGIGGTWVHFDEPMNWIGADHPGALAVQLWLQGELVYESDWFNGGGSGFFFGVVSTQPFDTAYYFKPVPPFSDNIVTLDDLHFGGIPAPGALAVILLGAITPRRRRR